MATTGNDPSLVAKALAKAQSVETRLNTLVGTGLGTPTQPTVLYTSSQTIVTQSSNGTFTWTCPAGVTSAMIECWGAGGGGNGSGTAEGGPGGGGGEYAQEPLFATIPGTVYSYTVGNGGSGGPAGSGGTSGGDSFFNFNGATGIPVYANAGDANNGFFTGGLGGTGSSNTIHNDGGAGGGLNDQSTGGCGGGGSGGANSAGGSGTSSVGSTGTAGGAGGAGGGAAGGAGGNSAANGVAGGGPGGGGGGGGAGTSSSITKTYSATGTRSYYGSNGSNPNATRQVNGTMWQGGTTDGGGSFNGDQKYICTFNQPLIASDFSGATITSCSFQVICEHTFYGSGMNIQINTWLAAGGAPTSWNGSSNRTFLFNSTIVANQQKTFSLGASVGAGFVSGTNFGIAVGPGPGSLNNFWYGYFKGASSPNLIVSGYTGSTAVAGAGHDGRVRITYNTPATLVASIQPAAVTDDSGNALAAGVTVAPANGATSGVVAVQPGSSPAVLETWHQITGGVGYQNSWTDAAALRGQYKLTGDNCVHIVGTFIPGTKTDNTVIFTLPAAYQPNKQICINVGVQGSSLTFSGAVPAAFLAVNTDGTCAIFGVNLGGTTSFVHVNGLVPLDVLN